MNKMPIISRYVAQVRARFCKFFYTKATQSKMGLKLPLTRSEIAGRFGNFFLIN
jgi:hypothetical protein